MPHVYIYVQPGTHVCVVLTTSTTTIITTDRQRPKLFKTDSWGCVLGDFSGFVAVQASLHHDVTGGDCGRASRCALHTFVQQKIHSLHVSVCTGGAGDWNTFDYIAHRISGSLGYRLRRSGRRNRESRGSQLPSSLNYCCIEKNGASRVPSALHIVQGDADSARPLPLPTKHAIFFFFIPDTGIQIQRGTYGLRATSHHRAFASPDVSWLLRCATRFTGNLNFY